MKRVAITAERQVELVDVPMPHASGNLVLVKVRIAPMCTEYKNFVRGTLTDCLGHEAVGEVVEVGSHSDVKIGDRVVAMPLEGCGVCDLCLAGDYIHCLHNAMRDATLAQYILKPAFVLKHIPDDVSDEMAALACCALGPSFGAFERMALNAFDTVLITGLGPVGLGAVVNARHRGARVIAVEVNEFRSRLALELGAEVVLDPRDPDLVRKIKDLCSGIGPDCAVDCSGTVAAHRTCIDAVRRKGQVAFIGECGDETPIVASRDFIRKGIALFGAWHYNLNSFPKVLQVIRHSPVAAKLISHVYPITAIQEAFEVSASQQCAKILVNGWSYQL